MVPELILGFIGLGVMGRPLAARLVAAGQRLIGYDIDIATLDAFAAETPQADTTRSLEEVAQVSQIIMTCLPTAEITEQVYSSLAAMRGAGGDRIWIDISSNPPDAAIRISQTAAAVGVAYVEAPMVGGVADATAGGLHILASHDVESGLPPIAGAVLKQLAAQVYETGAHGRASTIKALQNALGLVQLNAIAEVLNACDSAGIDLKLFTDIVGSAPGMANSPLFRRVAPEMIGISKRDTTRLAVARKDAAAGEHIAQSAGARHDMLTLSRHLFDEAGERGLADAEITRIIEIFRERRAGDEDSKRNS